MQWMRCFSSIRFFLLFRWFLKVKVLSFSLQTGSQKGLESLEHWSLALAETVLAIYQARFQLKFYHFMVQVRRTKDDLSEKPGC